jgi:hypothetical protein
MKLYRLLISSNGGETFHHYRNYESVKQACEAARVIPGHEYQVIEIRSGCIVASGCTRTGRVTQTRGWLNYEHK